MKFGLNLINFGPGASAESIGRSAEWAEQVGFHLVMVSDHVAVTPDVAKAYPAPFYEPFTALAWLAARTSRVPAEWVADLTFPDTTVDGVMSWQEREVLAWFDDRGIEFFEPLEIWHVAPLAVEFRRRTGRRPTPDRSYRPPWSERVRGLAWRAARAALRTPF